MLQPDEMGLMWDRPWQPTYHSEMLHCPVMWWMVRDRDADLLMMSIYIMPLDWGLVSTPTLEMRCRRLLVEFRHRDAPVQ